MFPIRGVLDTGAGPNIVHEKLLPPSWKEKAAYRNLPRVTDASRNSMTLSGMVKLHVRLGDFTTQAPFLVASNLAVDAILGTTFIDKHVRSILPRERRVVLRHGPPITLLGTKPGPEADRRANKGIPMATVSNKVRVAKQVLLPPMSQREVMVNTDARGLLFLQNHPKTVTKNLSLMANGIMECTGKPFWVTISNFRDRTVRLSKGSVVGLALPAPRAIVTVTTEQAASLGSLGPNRNASVPHGPERETIKPDWREQVDIGPEYAPHRKDILNLLQDFEGMWSGRLGTIKAAKHRIDLEEGAQPVYQPPYRAGHRARGIEKAEIGRMLQEGVIEPASSEWASPVVLVPKKDGTLRFCVDYRRLNKLTRRDSYPIPRMDECIDSLGDATVFTTLDCNSGYWQVEVDEPDRDKTTFTSHMGLFRFIRMPFGLKNAPATFQRAVDIVLSRVKWQYALVYLDDVIIYSKTLREHFTHLRTILDLLQEAGVSLKLPKCHFFQASVDYLGHVIRPGKLEVSTRTCDAIKRAKPPTTQTGIRSFIGLCNVFRRFVPNFARIATPLNRKLEKGQPFNFEVLTDPEYAAFEELKRRLVSPPILALPKRDGQYKLDTDACDTQVGSTLLQDQGGGDFHPVGYWSRALTKQEREYTTTEKECLAIVWSILLLRPYLEGQRFTVRTDHDSLKWVLNLADAKGRLARWRLRLSEFDFDVEHRAGVKHQAADALSRMETTGLDTRPLGDEIPCFTTVSDIPGEGLPCRGVTVRLPGIPEVLAVPQEESGLIPVTVSEILQGQREDSYCRAMTSEVGKAGSHFEVNRIGLLCRKAPVDGSLQVVIPQSLRARVLYLSHYPRLQGHPGATRMYETMRRDYYWPHMASDIHQTVTDCRSCARVRGTLRRHQKKLTLFPAAGPLEFVAMDLFGPLPKTAHGNKHILVITDRFTKMCRAIPLRTAQAPQVAQAFLDSWVYPYGVPDTLLTDNGPQFTAKFFESVCGLLGIRHVLTTAYHPQTNGQAERFNRTLGTRLRHYVTEHQRDWDEFVQPLTYAYNMQVHRSTGTTPFDLVLTRHPPGIAVSIPTSAVPPDRHVEPTTAQMKRITMRRLREVLARASEKLTHAQAQYKRQFDKTVSEPPTFLPGEEVFLDRPPDFSATALENEDGHRKLLPKTTGPYRIISADDNTVTIDRNGLKDTVSTDRVTRAPPQVITRLTDPSVGTRREPPPVTVDPDSTVPVTPNTVTPDGAPPPEPEYAIDRIVGHGEDDKGRPLYRVRWYGYPPEDDTWEPAGNIPDNFLRRYHARH